MEERENSVISFERIFRIAKKKILFIIAAALLFFGAAYAFMTFLVAPTYTISAQCYIRDPKSGLTQYQDNVYNRNVVPTYVQILKADDFFDLAYERLKADNADAASRVTARQIMGGTTFDSIEDTEVITMSYSSGDQELVYPVMRSIYESIQERISSAYNEDAEMHDVSMPKPSGVSVSTRNTRRVSIIAAVVGAVLMLVYLYIRDMMDVHIRGANTIVEKYNIPVLGRVPSFDPSLLNKKSKSKSSEKDKENDKTGESVKEATTDGE